MPLPICKYVFIFKFTLSSNKNGSPDSAGKSGFRVKVEKWQRMKWGKGSWNLQPEHPYGSIFWRFVAFLVDSLLVGLVDAGVDFLFGVPSGISPKAIAGLPSGPALLKLGVHLIYWPLFESSLWQATPGKRLSSLKVVDLAGNRISFVRAFCRNMAKVLSFLPLGFGFLMAFLTARNQALHDKIVGTVVLKSR